MMSQGWDDFLGISCSQEDRERLDKDKKREIKRQNDFTHRYDKMETGNMISWGAYKDKQRKQTPTKVKQQVSQTYRN